MARKAFLLCVLVIFLLATGFLIRSAEAQVGRVYELIAGGDALRAGRGLAPPKAATPNLWPGDRLILRPSHTPALVQSVMAGVAIPPLTHSYGNPAPACPDPHLYSGLYSDCSSIGAAAGREKPSVGGDRDHPFFGVGGHSGADQRHVAAVKSNVNIKG